MGSHLGPGAHVSGSWPAGSGEGAASACEKRAQGHLSRGERRVSEGTGQAARHKPRGRVHVGAWQGAAGRLLVLRQDQGLVVGLLFLVSQSFFTWFRSREIPVKRMF